MYYANNGRNTISYNCLRHLTRKAVNQKSLFVEEGLKPSSNFIAVRPKAALLFWFFGGFRCGVPLFIVFFLYINRKIGKNR